MAWSRNEENSGLGDDQDAAARGGPGLELAEGKPGPISLDISVGNGGMTGNQGGRHEAKAHEGPRPGRPGAHRVAAQNRVHLGQRLDCHPLRAAFARKTSARIRAI